MPRTCAVSGAKYQKINKRSHSMQATIVHREPNFVLDFRPELRARSLKMLLLDEWHLMQRVESPLLD